MVHARFPSSASSDTGSINNTPVAFDWMQGVSNETSKSWRRRIENGFFSKYCMGNVLDVGFEGSSSGVTNPVLPWAIGVDRAYPGYNGIKLPFPDEVVDTVYSSHLFEHLLLPEQNIRDWYRVLKVGGYIVCIVPHKHLYERKSAPPSNWNMDHVFFYTPARLLHVFEQALEVNSYRVRHLCDNDAGYDYSLPLHRHAVGAYEIELVIQKIAQDGRGVPR